jgi:hypothetical protein
VLRADGVRGWICGGGVELRGQKGKKGDERGINLNKQQLIECCEIDRDDRYSKERKENSENDRLWPNAGRLDAGHRVVYRGPGPCAVISAQDTGMKSVNVGQLWIIIKLQIHICTGYGNSLYNMYLLTYFVKAGF